MNNKLLIDEEILIFKNERKQILNFIKQKILTKNINLIQNLQTQIYKIEEQSQSSNLLINELSNKQKTELELEISKNQEMLQLAIAENKEMLQLEFSKLKTDKSKESILILADLEKNVLKLISSLEKSINKQWKKIIDNKEKVAAASYDFIEETIEFNWKCLQILQTYQKNLEKLQSKTLKLTNKKLETLNSKKDKYIKKETKDLTRLIGDKKGKIKKLEKTRNTKSQKNNQPSFFSFNKIFSFIKKIIEILINKKSNAEKFHYENFQDLIKQQQKQQKLNNELDAITIKINTFNQELTFLNQELQDFTSQDFTSQVIAECNNEKKLPLLSPDETLPDEFKNECNNEKKLPLLSPNKPVGTQIETL